MMREPAPSLRGFFRFAARLAAGCLLACAFAAAAAALPCRLSLVIQDTLGDPLEARVRVLGSDGHVHPDTLDPARLVHRGANGFCYASGSFWVNVPQGVTRVTVGRGFEWKPFDRVLNIRADTTLQVTLVRFVDLGAQGWYGGDMHAHSQHPPLDYGIPPSTALMIAHAEGISVFHLLDQDYHFTGQPDALSDAQTILYYTVEYRNQTYAHIALPGLNHLVPFGCCLDPAAPYPMVIDLRHDVVPAKGPMIAFAHPHTTDDYFHDTVWPGAGLGRELPVDAALGALDVLDVASYSNVGYTDWSEWYDVLSAGLPCPASAGTDALLSDFWGSPPGGWRVYACLGPGAPLNYDAWIAALQSGSTFVTNYPLIPDFGIATSHPGQILEVDSDTLSATAHIHALCAVGLLKISVIADGSEAWVANLNLHHPTPTEVDTTFTLNIPTPSWLVARVLGVAGNPHAAIGSPEAQTSAIRILRSGLPVRRTGASGRWLDSLDKLDTLVNQRGGWDAPWEHDTVMARINRARAFYSSAFVVPPNPFQLLAPGFGDTVQASQLVLQWSTALDLEDGDKVSYMVRVGSDSLLSYPMIFQTTNTSLGNLNLALERTYWWAVDAIDRGHNDRRGTPWSSKFYLTRNVSSAPDHAALLPGKPGGFPNPSRDRVRIEGFIEPVSILDAAGRRVAGTGDGVVREGGHLTWDGMSHGHPAPPGLYWVRDARGKPVTRLIRLR